MCRLNGLGFGYRCIQHESGEEGRGVGVFLGGLGWASFWLARCMGREQPEGG